jgi:pyridoxal phosphate enzyme (YggS family)
VNSVDQHTARRTELAANWQRLGERVAAACARAGRAEDSVRVIAVSKFKPASDVRLAYELGVRHFGENYVQELTAKSASVLDLHELTWHVIGHLQRNKVKLLAPLHVVLHTLDGERLAREVVQRWPSREHSVFVEVNLGHEPNKAGCLPEDVDELIEKLREMPLRLEGLMAIPPALPDPEASRPYFRQLRALAERLQLPRVSMGMSHDFEVAIEEGATDVRIGTALFGARA